MHAGNATLTSEPLCFRWKRISISRRLERGDRTPRGTRKLFFDSHEFEVAALGHCRGEGNVLPRGRPGALTLGTGLAVALRRG